jgi:hypothetical protein
VIRFENPPLTVIADRTVSIPLDKTIKIKDGSEFTPQRSPNDRLVETPAFKPKLNMCGAIFYCDSRAVPLSNCTSTPLLGFLDIFWLDRKDCD